MNKKKTLLVIENDYRLEKGRHDYVLEFMDKYDGEIIVMTQFAACSKTEILQNVMKATDIAVQTCLIGGSDYQFDDMVELMAKISHPVTIYMALLGDDLQTYLIDHLKPKQLYALKHHTIYELGRDWDDRLGGKGTNLVDLTSVTDKYEKKLSRKRIHALYIDWYKQTAPSRPTGRKVKVLACNANGPAFNNLPIGEIVDELDCVDLEESKKGALRGIWIMGNGEPIKLVNDCGLIEYEIADKLSLEELLVEMSKSTPINISKLKPLTIEGLLHVLKNEEDSALTKANFICEELKIEKRHNRSRIASLITQNLQQ